MLRETLRSGAKKHPGWLKNIVLLLRRPGLASILFLLNFAKPI